MGEAVHPSLWPSVGFLLGLLLLSSLIALVGDWVGRRVGKRRLSLLGLRPRDTAILFTLLTGMLIAGFTVSVLALVSEHVRDALLHLGRIKQERQLLEQENLRLRQEQQGLRQQIGQIQAALEERQKALQEQSARLEQVRGQLAQVRQEHQRARQEVARLQGRLRSTQRDLQGARREFQALQDQLRSMGEQLARVHRELQAAQGELEKAVAIAGQEFQRAQALEQQRRQLEQEVARMEASRQTLLRQAQRAMELLASFQTGSLVAEAGEELARGALDAHWPADRLQERLRELLQQADRQVAQRGAGSSPPRRQVMALGLRRSPEGEVEILSEEVVLQQVARDIQSLAQRVIVRVVALRRFVEGEQVLVGFDIHPERLVFREGEVLAEAVADPRKEEAEIFTTLLLLLRQVHERARRAGLLPGPEGQFGAVPYGEIFAQMRRIRQAPGPVQVQALAARSIWSGDPLEIRFIVRAESASRRPMEEPNLATR